jgi:hypothetical protein
MFSSLNGGIACTVPKMVNRLVFASRPQAQVTVSSVAPWSLSPP